jgi:N-acetylglucosaminyl-diphospho-decaprenol L-rhamnosyltransferase
MSISRHNLSIVIVTLKSEKVIDKCINSIGQDIPIIVIENSNNQQFKNYLESTYKNVKCVLSGSNLGMGRGNNIGINYARTDFVYILNPDVILEENTLEEIFLASKDLKDFSIISPINKDLNFPNYKNKIDVKENSPFQVKSIDGFSMLLNKNKFKDKIFFDENFFLYLENDDLCFRVNKLGGSVFIIPSAKITHHGSMAVDNYFKDEVELSRNWHWIWSKFYFNKKNFNLFRAFYECLPNFISSIFKFLFYLLINNKFKKKIYLNRASGFYNALIGKSSWYRPKIND